MPNSLMSKPTRSSTSFPADKQNKAEHTRIPEGLTERGVKLARGLWSKNIDHQQAMFGVIIFRELFLAHPEYEYFFLHMKQQSQDNTLSLFQSVKFRIHMTDKLVATLKEIVDKMDKPGELRVILTYLGEVHARLRIRRRHVQDMLEVILAATRKLLGNKLMGEEEEAFKNSLAVAFEIMAETIDDYRTKNPEEFNQPYRRSS